MAPAYVAGVVLWRNRIDETRPSLLETPRGPSPTMNLVAVMAMPAVAAALALFAVAGTRLLARR